MGLKRKVSCLSGSNQGPLMELQQEPHVAQLACGVCSNEGDYPGLQEHSWKITTIVTTGKSEQQANSDTPCRQESDFLTRNIREGLPGSPFFKGTTSPLSFRALHLRKTDPHLQVCNALLTPTKALFASFLLNYSALFVAERVLKWGRCIVEWAEGEKQH